MITRCSAATAAAVEVTWALALLPVASLRRWPITRSRRAGLSANSRRGRERSTGSDLAVAPGEIYGFLGPNGAGKSTTVHVLTTLLPPTAGSARVGGFDVVHQGPKVRTVIGAALQEAALDP